VIEKPEILKNDSDSPAEIRALGRRILGNIPSEKIDKATRWTQRHK
jgi:hypothetical protein